MEVKSRIKEKLPANALLTRYIDLHSFLYFITQNKLRFARLDTFEDLNEGFSGHTAEALKGAIQHSRAIKGLANKEKMLESVNKLKARYAELEQQYSAHQKNLFACCWYLGEKESVAMWNLYSNADSVAIRFNANQLIEILAKIAANNNHPLDKVQYGAVEYADLSTTPGIGEDCMGFLKDDSFSHEKEFRFMAERNADDDALEFELCLGDLKQVDFTIISHPKMEEWKIRNILNVLACYQLTEKFQPSQLALKNI
jgi:hypothetical protein